MSCGSSGFPGKSPLDPCGVRFATAEAWVACPRCGERLELIALIENAAVTRRILSHLGLPTDEGAIRAVPTGMRGTRYKSLDRTFY